MPSFNHLTLQTRRLLLRPLREADAQSLLAMFNDTKFMQFSSGPQFDSIEQVLAFIERESKAMVSGLRIRLGIERIGDKTLMGHCDLFDLNEADKEAEIGYALSSSAWGRGYMTEALSALLDYGFAQLKLNRVCAVVDANNATSTKMMHRLEFIKEDRQHADSIGNVLVLVYDSCRYLMPGDKWLMKRDI